MRNLSGWMILTAGVGLLLFNLSDVIADLRDWHGVAALSPEFVGACMKQVGSAVLMLISGQVIPSLKVFGAKPCDSDTVSVATRTRL